MSKSQDGFFNSRLAAFIVWFALGAITLTPVLAAPSFFHGLRLRDFGGLILGCALECGLIGSIIKVRPRLPEAEELIDPSLPTHATTNARSSRGLVFVRFDSALSAAATWFVGGGFLLALLIVFPAEQVGLSSHRYQQIVYQSAALLGIFGAVTKLRPSIRL